MTVLFYIIIYINEVNLGILSYTGTTFDRPTFKRMLQDLDAGILSLYTSLADGILIKNTKKYIYTCHK